MQTELEKTQLEIAKAQLAQEQIKLAKMQRNQQTLNNLGRGAVALGEGAARSTLNGVSLVSALIRASLTLMLFTLLVLVVVLAIKAAVLPGVGGFGYRFGQELGMRADIVAFTTLGMPVLYYGLRLLFRASTEEAFLGVIVALVAASVIVAFARGGIDVPGWSSTVVPHNQLEAPLIPPSTLEVRTTPAPTPAVQPQAPPVSLRDQLYEPDGRYKPGVVIQGRGSSEAASSGPSERNMRAAEAIETR